MTSHRGTEVPLWRSRGSVFKALISYLSMNYVIWYLAVNHKYLAETHNSIPIHLHYIPITSPITTPTQPENAPTTAPDRPNSAPDSHNSAPDSHNTAPDRPNTAPDSHNSYQSNDMPVLLIYAFEALCLSALPTPAHLPHLSWVQCVSYLFKIPHLVD